MESGKAKLSEFKNYIGRVFEKICLYDVDTNECRVYGGREVHDFYEFHNENPYDDKFVINIKLGDRNPHQDEDEALADTSVDVYLSDNPKESVENKMPDYNSGEMKFGELRNYFDSSVRLAMWVSTTGKEDDETYERFGSKDAVPDTYNEKYIIGFSYHWKSFKLADVPERIAEKKESHKDESEEELLKIPVLADCIEVLMSDYPREEEFRKEKEAREAEEALEREEYMAKQEKIIAKQRAAMEAQGEALYENLKVKFGDLRNYLGKSGFRRCLYDFDANEFRVLEPNENNEDIPESYNDKYVIKINLSEKNPDGDFGNFFNSSVDIYLTSNTKDSVDSNVPDFNSGEMKFGELRNYFDSSVRLVLRVTNIAKEKSVGYELFGSKDVVPDIYNDKFVIGFSKNEAEFFKLADVPERIAGEKEKYKDESEEELLEQSVIADSIEVLMSDCPRDEYFRKIMEAMKNSEEWLQDRKYLSFMELLDQIGPKNGFFGESEEDEGSEEE